MPARRVNAAKAGGSKGAPATTPMARENQLIALAYDLAEQQLRDGTASAQVVAQLIKFGSSREKLEQERMDMEIELGKAKQEMMASNARSEEMMAKALKAFQSYSGATETEDDGYED